MLPYIFLQSITLQGTGPKVMPFPGMEDYSSVQLITLGISYESNKLPFLGKQGYQKHTQAPETLSSQRAACLMTSSYSTRSKLFMQTSTQTLKNQFFVLPVPMS